MHTPAGFVSGHALPAVLPATTLAFVFHGDRLLVAGGEGATPGAPVAARVPTLAALAAAAIDGPRHYLGALAGLPCVALRVADDTPPSSGWRFAGLRSLFFALPDAELALAARAFQVVEWDRTHRWCGACGTPTRDRAGERAKECPACGLVAYPRVSPAMMVLVTRGREVLLARAHRFPPGMYSALAGFVEPGETIEDCIRREVREEVGVDIDDPSTSPASRGRSRIR